MPAPNARRRAIRSSPRCAAGYLLHAKRGPVTSSNMITGIDEVGDFSLASDTLHYFVAVHIDQNQNRYAIKQSQFKLWEDNIPSGIRENGEVKGRLLTDDQAQSFYEQVVMVEPKLLISSVGTIPSENTLAAIAKHVEIEAAAIEKVVRYHTEQGNPSARTYEQLRIWHKKFARSPAMYLKLKCLEHLIKISVPYILEYAQLTCFQDQGDDHNLRSASFKIDKDYVRAPNVMTFWREHLRQSLMHTGGPLTVPFLPFWTREESPLHKYYPLVGSEGVNLKELFQQRIEFVDSKNHWEARIADVLAAILHRVRNRGRLQSLEADIEHRMNVKIGNTKHIVFTESVGA